MSLHIDARELFTTTGLSNSVSQGNVSTGSDSANTVSANSSKGKSVRASSILQQIKNASKKKNEVETTKIGFYLIFIHDK